MSSFESRLVYDKGRSAALNSTLNFTTEARNTRNSLGSQVPQKALAVKTTFNKFRVFRASVVKRFSTEHKLSAVPDIASVQHGILCTAPLLGLERT
jgi:hypothetical protein